MRISYVYDFLDCDTKFNPTFDSHSKKPSGEFDGLHCKGQAIEMQQGRMT